MVRELQLLVLVDWKKKIRETSMLLYLPDSQRKTLAPLHDNQFIQQAERSTPRG